ncbi:hypothetical protein Q0Z83_049640 [Actinoplanes sichuanensis]|uniref:PepSY domain-containing protein n=1 Tax=Actinoplanes sichuanensis TaxID=512349 RepID=A0ABW4ANV0_9ACTN|nr:hypothetical protein [Actinoplanes sichuanensis]BEL06773.1 hypothetical protein Q0Z83_049640 [Actinoplanes sichuanensis]
MSVKKIGVLAVGAVAAGGLALGGAAVASAAPATPTPSTSADGPGGKGDGHGRPGGKGEGHGRHGGKHTEVTGDEAAKVTAAVTAKDSAVTVARVLKDDDGSYHVVGTKDGKRIGFEVSADLKTVTEREARPGRGPGGGFGGGTEVTGDEAAKVTAAVTAKDTGVTVSRVVKGPDGAYHVLGTKGGERVHFEVSADLTTVTEGKRGPGGHGPKPDGRRPAPSPSRTS